MLHAYELGMLSDADRERFEMHMLDCESCFERVRENEQASHLMKFDSDIRDTVQQVVRQSQSSSAGHPAGKAPTGRRNVIRTLIPTLAAAAVLLLLLLKPWQISITPDDAAIATENRLAVMYFENLIDPQDSLRTGEIITNLLITDLSESQYIRTVSSQRIYDILKLMGFEGTGTVQKDIATRVAREAEARWMLMGAIVQTEPRMILTSQLVDVSSGNAIAAQRIVASEGEDVFALVDRLTVTIKTDLVLPAGALQEVDRHIADVTTHSTEAFRHYVEAVDFYNKYYYGDALRSFRRVIELDSTFAMAHYYVARMEMDTVSRARALQYSENASEKDRYFIRSNEALLNRDLEGAASIMEQMLERYGEDKQALALLALYRFRQARYVEAIDHYTRIITIDPLYKSAYNMLAYSYDRTGDIDNAIWAINKYISLAPNEANPYDSRGDIYSNNRQYELAIDSYRKALEKKPDFINSKWKLSYYLLRSGRVDEADSSYKDLRKSDQPGIAFTAGLYQAILPIWQGKLNLALERIEQHNAWTQKDRPNGVFPSCFTIKAFIQRELGDLDSALIALRQGQMHYREASPSDSTYGRRFEIQLLAELGRIDEAAREAESYKQHLQNRNLPMHTYQYALGVIALQQDNLDDAIEYLTAAGEDTTSRYPECSIMLGRAFLEAERYSEAAEILADISGDLNRWPETMDVWLIKSHYYLGLAYEGMGDATRAVEQYNWFIETWKDADVAIPSLTDATERLARLKS
jgi:tetratricopeptide (TPR) repeat protein